MIEAYLEYADGPYVLETLPLDYAHGYVPQVLNLGFPEVREDSNKRPNQDGTFDLTKNFGAASVQLTVALAPELMVTPLTETQLEDKLRAWMHPTLRAWLTYRITPADEWRRVLVRSSTAGRSWNFARTTFGQVSMVWRAPRGVKEGTVEQSEYLSFIGTEAGRTYDRSGDRSYPASPVLGVREVWNYGTAEAFPLLRIYGPATGFRLENQTTGKALWFKDAFALLTAEYLEIDFEEGTVAMAGDLSNSRYDELKIPDNEWWTLVPGMNLIRPIATSFTAPDAHMEMFFNYRYL